MPPTRSSVPRLLAATTKDAQQVEEEVDEVQEEPEGADERDLASSLLVALLGDGGGIARDPLGVIGDEASEDDHAEVGQAPVEPVLAGQEDDVHQRANDEADQRHEQDRAELREVYLGREADDRHDAEHRGGGHKGGRDGWKRVGYQHGRDHEAEERGEEEVHQRADGQTRPLDDWIEGESDNKVEYDRADVDPGIGEERS